MTPTIYSVGYQGMELSALVEALTSVRVRTVFDVRLNPVSRRKGFSRQTLGAALEAAGITYVHDKELGNPPQNRQRVRRGDEEGRRYVRAVLVDRAGPSLRRLVDEARTGPIAVLCVERDHDRCHRQVVIDLAREHEPTIEVRPIP